MKQILIVAHFPTGAYVKEGMAQRILFIDQELEFVPRKYLQISLRKNFIRKVDKKSDNLSVEYVNLFFHFFTIYKILKKSSIVYIHSLYNFERIFFYPLKGKKIILDVHGIVPEELRFMGNKFRSYFFSCLERKAIGVSNILIAVTKSMKVFYQEKYPDAIFKIEVIPIQTTKKQILDNNELEFLKSKYSISKEDVVFIYSGNCQEWQNIELMLHNIKKLIHIKNFKFLILTGELNKMKRLIFNELGNMPFDNLFIDSVSPGELPKYYSIAHYGFVLRDDHPLNKVANPTKIVDYMMYGIIPIVKSAEIGDFLDFDYEFLAINNISEYTKPKKSEKNIRIIQEIQDKYKTKLESILS